ncbi:DNA-binding protein [Candidatus Woesearchaeota archaeon]|nr:DNA-binding protein [Candidatus Woesearchaeota archaeon]
MEQAQLEQLEQAVKSLMSPQAVQRYNNVKLVHPELALRVLVGIAQLAQQGKIVRVEDDTLKQLLATQQKRETKITFR